MSAPKKPLMGRPPKYPEPYLLQAALDAYFLHCDTSDPREPYTVAGMCVFLNLTKEGLREYGEKPDFSALVKRPS